MQLFYNPNISESSTFIDFDKEESRHIVKVLRKQVGDILSITNGNGWQFKAELTSANFKKISTKIVSKSFKEPKPYQLHLAVAPTKSNDRYEWFLEKATEIGVTEITPIICNNSERKVLKTERLERIIQSAMKQSLKSYLPKLNRPISFQDFINNPISGQKFIAHCEELDKKNLKRELLKEGSHTILIGPEGDFSVKEIETALLHEYIPVTLGNTRLRTETAAIVACHTCALHYEN